MASVERILIVGGGIAGLTLGAALHQRSFSAELIERSASWEAIGAGIAVQANGLRALDALGLACTMVWMPALGDQAKQPRFAAARIGLNEKAGVDQRREIELQLFTSDDLPDNHGLFHAAPKCPAPPNPPQESPSAILTRRPRRLWPQTTPGLRGMQLNDRARAGGLGELQ